MITVISLGAGVQSSTMALMAARGEITPMPDCAIFADTQAEPKHVYDWLDWLEKQLPFPVYRVTAGSLRAESLTQKIPKEGEPYIRNVVPAFTLDAYGNKGMLLRRCTGDFKIAPINRKVRELVGKLSGGVMVEEWIGISYDEMQRMKDAPQKYIKHRWPLIELSMTRGHCLEWMRDRQYPKPPRSACTFCPYHKDEEWLRLKNDDPESFADAVLFEQQWNNAVKLDLRPSQTRGKIFLHRSMVPLDQANFDGPSEHGQLSFLDECDGMCGV